MKTVTRCAVASLIAALCFAYCYAVALLFQGKAPSGVQPCPGMQPSGLLTLPGFLLRKFSHPAFGS